MNEFDSVLENSVASVAQKKSKKIKRVSFRKSLRPMKSLAKAKSLRPKRIQVPIELYNIENTEVQLNN